MFDDYFKVAAELTAAGEPFATAVIVRAAKPTSGKPGDRALVTRDGLMHGWIGGSCAQPTVIQQALAAMKDGKNRLIRLSPDPDSEEASDGMIQVPMTCFSGGALDVFIEPHEPRPELLIVGNSPVARALAQLGKAMSYRVLVVDPGGPVASDQADVPIEHADHVASSLAEIGELAGAATFAVVATHGEYDEPALKAVLDSQARYVGLVASRKRGHAVMDLLGAEGVSDQELSRVKFPAGLDIGAQRGDEIALSIMAEIVEVLRGGDVVEPSASPGTGGAEAAELDGGRELDGARELDEGRELDGTSQSAGQVGAENALDPICKMTVQVEGALHTYVHEGSTYYFCCAGCRGTFMKNPEAWLATTS